MELSNNVLFEEGNEPIVIAELVQLPAARTRCNASSDQSNNCVQNFVCKLVPLF
jgi:hypothetical protein